MENITNIHSYYLHLINNKYQHLLLTDVCYLNNKSQCKNFWSKARKNLLTKCITEKKNSTWIIFVKKIFTRNLLKKKLYGLSLFWRKCSFF